MPTISIRGARLYFRLEGRPGLPGLALLHPLGADHSLWDAVVPLLTPHFQVLRPDLRGHGGSETTPGEYSVDQLADDLLGLTAAIGWDRFRACGLSLGALACLRAAAAAPGRVHGLVLCSSAAHMHAPPGGWDQRARQALESGMAPLAGPMVERMFSAGFRQTGHPLIETLRTVFLHTDPAGYAAAVAVLRDADLEPDLPRVLATTLVLTGAQDALIPATAAELYLARIAGSRHLTLPGGHFPPLEAPEEFAAALVSGSACPPA